MLKKKERISRKVFNTVFSQAKVLYRGSFFIIKKSQSPDFQASVVISKKVAKKATERNYIKRSLYHCISQYKKKNPDISGIYIYIIQKKPIQISDLHHDFQKAFNS